jgi:hypothetical protein
MPDHPVTRWQLPLRRSSNFATSARSSIDVKLVICGSGGRMADMVIEQTTLCNSPPNEVIRSAQRAVVDLALGIFAGPDTDTIGVADRYDGCHMAQSGLIKHASLWVEALTAGMPI